MNGGRQDFSAKGARTLDVMRAIRRKIANRALGPGDRLPSIRNFAKTMQVSPSTVVEAYDRLAADGVIRAKRGSGFYVSTTALPPLALAEDLPQTERAVDPFWVSRQSLDADPATVKPGCGWLPADWMPQEDLRRSLRTVSRGEGAVLSDYGSTRGTIALRRLLMGRFADEGIDISPEQLTPDQRVAFVLHDGFAMPFSEIAEVLGVTPAAARQLASRARRTVAGAPKPADEHAEVVGKLLAAMASGDVVAVVELLHPEVTFTGDANRRAPTAPQVIRGRDKVARFLFGLARRYGPRLFEVAAPGLVNGELGMVTAGAAANDEWPAIAPRIQAMTVSAGRVVAIYDIANPDKFTGSPLGDARARGTTYVKPTAPGRRPRS